MKKEEFSDLASRMKHVEFFVRQPNGDQVPAHLTFAMAHEEKISVLLRMDSQEPDTDAWPDVIA